MDETFGGAQPTVYGTADVSYRLVDWNHLVSVQNGYSQKGYVLVGQCDFAEQTGVPLQQNAVDYARYLGADLVVYSVQQTPDGQTEHYIDFLAKTGLDLGRKTNHIWAGRFLDADQRGGTRTETATSHTRRARAQVGSCVESSPWQRITQREIEERSLALLTHLTGFLQGTDIEITRRSGPDLLAFVTKF